MKLKNILPLFLIVLFSACSRDTLPVDPGFDEGTNVARTQVISPAFGETWQPGTTHDIKWSFYHGKQKVNLLLYRKTEFKLMIAGSVENNGAVKWTVPADADLSVHYRIKIVNTEDESVSLWSDYFYIKTDSETAQPD